MLEWQKLLNGDRRKDKHGGISNTASANGRVELERDYDRILFATPTRRLADKTQVFPLERNDSVRNRLTHSHEVSSLARSIGIQLAFEHKQAIFGDDFADQPGFLERCVPALLSAIGLVHDLGNPPFGHQGETAIQNWFKRNQQNVFGNDEVAAADFTHFDGNAQTFRLVTRLQILNDRFGLNLTYGTLASMIKYPIDSASKANSGWKKHGFFQSETEIIQDIWQETGLKPGIRHPLTYIMEACDDIAYSVLDAEDIVKKGFASFSDLIDHLSVVATETGTPGAWALKQAKKKNTEFKKELLSPRELNDVSMQMFRVYAVSAMVKATIEQFVADKDKLMSGKLAPDYDLIKMSPAAAFCKSMKQFDRAHGYNHKSVLELELKGNNYINSLMDMLWTGIQGQYHNHSDLFSRYAYQRISENYRRVFEESNKQNTSFSDAYLQAQLLTDAIAGMTDSYLIHIHDELEALRG